MKKTIKPVISIIVPVYNAERFLNETISTVLNQTYQDWELLLIDDASTDNSLNIIEAYAKRDKRIRIYRNTKNSKAGITRNKGIKNAKGRFICFLDADDLWENDKLEKQLDFMYKNECAFSFTGYEFADESGLPNAKRVYVPSKISYKQALKNTTIWTSTVMFDMSKLSKEDIYMPDIPRGQDTATWWKVLNKIDYAYGLNEILSYYRRTNNSLSSNKITALKRTWNLYRNIEHLNVLKTSYYFSCYCFNAIKRRI